MREELRKEAEELLLDYHFWQLNQVDLVRHLSPRLIVDATKAANLLREAFDYMPDDIKKSFENYVVLKFTPREMAIMKDGELRDYEREYEDLIEFVGCLLFRLKSEEVANDK